MQRAAELQTELWRLLQFIIIVNISKKVGFFFNVKFTSYKRSFKEIVAVGKVELNLRNRKRHCIVICLSLPCQLYQQYIGAITFVARSKGVTRFSDENAGLCITSVSFLEMQLLWKNPRVLISIKFIFIDWQM